MTHYPNPEAQPQQYGQPAHGQPAQYGQPAHAQAGFAPEPPAAPVGRPVLLIVAVAAGVIAALTTIIASALVLGSGKELVEAAIDKVLGDLANLASPAEKAKLVDEAVGALAAKSWAAIVSGVLVLVFALLSLGGKTWARVVYTVLVVGGMCGMVPLLMEGDVVPDGTYMTLFLGFVLSLIPPILLFLPPVNRFAKARRS